ncbi:hypothetical protein ABE142_17250 [Paenibacillus alvei]|uniref:hypothetical protein n=1 Tax=Paenibacillus alvei TaxID=44250 RepID=UPI003D26ED40
MRTELAEEVQKYKDFIEEELTQTISMDKLVALFKEMSSAARREMAIDLHLPSVRTSKSMPTILFIKEIRKYVKSRQDHFNRKYTLITSIIKQLMVILEEEDENSLEAFLTRQESIVAEHGFWHYYWSLYFHPGRTEQESLWNEAMEELESREGLITEFPAEAVLHMASEPSSLSEEAAPAVDTSEPSTELEHRLIEMKKKLNHEAHLRKQAENALGKTEKQIHRLNRQLSDTALQLQQVEQKLKQVQQDKDVHIQELEAQITQFHEELRLSRQERSKLLKESELMQQEVAGKEEQTESIRHELHSQEEKLTQLRRQLAVLRADNDELNRQCMHLKKSAAAAKAEVLHPKSLTSSVQVLIQLLYADVEDTLHAARHAAVHSGKDGRQKIRMSLELIDELEQFIEARSEPSPERSVTPPEHSHSGKAQPEGQLNVVHEHQRHESIPYAESACALESGGTALLEREAGSNYTEPYAIMATDAAELSDETDESGVNGTFFRRDHGGYIVLETGQTFNITESLVLQHQLQHEAGVLCRPKQHDPTQYDIELLLQGDDSNSSIVQYDGYVQLGEHFTWYCVDLNDPQSRFPLHERDVAIRTPKDGDPCSFNVEIGKRVARLSRLYRAQPGLELEAKRTAMNGSQGQGGAGARAAKAQAKKEYEKPEPFLEGHQITIVGGLKKWFEEVVAETGAVLVHENGKNPKRIFHDLKRSSALFLLLTATSHQAYWDCVEIAKQNQIPFYFIEGSKSNLRHLLWSHQEQIIAHAKAN